MLSNSLVIVFSVIWQNEIYPLPSVIALKMVWNHFKRYFYFRLKPLIYLHLIYYPHFLHFLFIYIHLKFFSHYVTNFWWLILILVTRFWSLVTKEIIKIFFYKLSFIFFKFFNQMRICFKRCMYICMT